MTLSERSRSALYQGFSAVVEEDAVQEMLSFFPARDVEEPVTKEFLRAELSSLELRVDKRLNQMELRLGASVSSEINKMMWLNIGALTSFAAVLLAAIKF